MEDNTEDVVSCAEAAAEAAAEVGGRLPRLLKGPRQKAEISFDQLRLSGAQRIFPVLHAYADQYTVQYGMYSVAS